MRRFLFFFGLAAVLLVVSFFLESFRSILAAGVLVTFPFLIGSAAPLRQASFAWRWSVGALFLLALFGLFVVLPLPFWIFAVLSVAVAGLGLARDFRGGLAYGLPVGVMVIAVLYAAFFRSFSPYPLQVGQDLFVHAHVVHGILEGLFSFDLASYSSSINFTAYSPLYHVLSALAVWLFGVPVVGVHWALLFVLFPVFAVGVFRLSRSAGQSEVFSFFAALLSLLPLEIGRAAGLHFPSPSSFLIALAPWFLLYTQEASFSRDWWRLALLSLVALSVHFVFGALLVSLMLLFSLRRKWQVLSLVGAAWLLAITVFLVPGVDSWLVELISLGDRFSYDLPSKLDLLSSWYGWPLILLGVAGALYWVFAGDLRQVMLGGGLLVSLAAFFIPLSFSTRLAVFLRVFIGVSSVAALDLIIRPLYRNSLWRSFGVALLGMVLVVASLAVTLGFMSDTAVRNGTDGIVSSFSRSELAAAGWIRENTVPDALVIAEPVTQNVIGSLAHRESLGGMFMPVDSRRRLMSALPSDPSSLCDVSSRPMVLVWNGRMERWLQRGISDDIYSNSWYPVSTRAPPQEDSLTLGYSDSEVYVYGLEC